MTEERPKMAPKRVKMAPRRTQKRPKMAPGQPKIAPKRFPTDQASLETDAKTQLPMAFIAITIITQVSFPRHHAKCVVV